MTDTPRGSAALRDLLLRADDAAKQLERMSREPHNRGLRSAHLVSKAEGVRLVIGYIEEALGA